MQQQRQRVYTDLERQADTEAFLRNVEVREIFTNQVPHVAQEKVVKPTGLPPAEWRLA